MKFSIIIPVYNVQNYIVDCLESVLSQECKDFEIILIDDGSTDNSGAICDQFSQLHKEIHVIHQKNMGLSGARNSGILQAKGEYILFLDSDDFYMNKFCLQKIHAKANHCDIVVFNGVFRYEGTEKQMFLIPQNSGSYKCGHEYLQASLKTLIQYPWYICIYAIRREFWLSQKFQFKEGIYFEDMELTYRVLLAAGEVRAIPDPIYVYRQRRGSIINSLNIKTEMDRIDHIEKNIYEITNNCTIDLKLKEYLCTNFSASFYVISSHLFCIEKSNREKLIKMIQKRKWIYRYNTIGILRKIERFFVFLFGTKCSCYIFSFIYIIKHWYEN